MFKPNVQYIVLPCVKKYKDKYKNKIAFINVSNASRAQHNQQDASHFQKFQ